MMDPEFQTKMFEVIVRRSLRVKDIAHAIDVSQSTVRRWIIGANLPHATMRQTMLRLLEEYQRS